MTEIPPPDCPAAVIFIGAMLCSGTDSLLLVLDRGLRTNIGKVILQDHIQHCIVDAVEHDDEQALDALCQAIDKFVK